MITFKTLSKRGLKTTLFTFSLSCLLLILFTSFSHTLNEDGQWIKGRSHQDLSLGDEFFFSMRQSLAGGKLRIDTYGGFEELYTKKKISNIPITINLDIELPEGTFLFILMKDSIGNRYGVRLSRHKRFPSQFILISAQGKFLEKHKITVESLKTEEHVVLHAHSSNQFELTIGGKAYSYSFKTPLSLPYRFGFKGGYFDDIPMFSSGAKVDNIQISEQNHILLQDSFSYLFNKINLLYALVLAIVITFIVLIINRNTALIMINIIFLMVAFNVLEYSILSYRQFDFESFFSDSYEKYLDEVLHENIATFRKREQKGELRHKRKVLLFGGSKTVGAGALKQEDKWSLRWEKLLNEQGQQNVAVINFGISGASLTHIKEYYLDTMKLVNPDITLFLIGVNDSEDEYIIDKLKQVLLLSHRFSSKNIIVPEFPFEGDIDNKFDNYIRLKNFVPLQKELIWLDTYKEMSQEDREDGGILWSDFVHFTSYGQDLFAKHLFELWMNHSFLNQRVD